ncbi:hypothetical protein OU793_11495, partial [Vibrio sp. VP6]
MATREKHLQYGKSLGLWQGGRKVIEPDVDRRIERVKAALAERDAEELRQKRAVQQENAYVSDSLLASQEAQKHSPQYAEGKSIAEIYGIPAHTEGLASQLALSDSIGLQCSLEEEMAKNHQHVMIVDLEDAHKILHNVWLDAGKNVAALAMSINTVKSWLKHAFVNGTRINMDGKKYPLNSFKSMQAGFSPQSRAANFKGAGALTFVVSASIATTDLIFKDDYHLVDWFGNVGSDMFKFMLQSAVGEAALFAAAFLGQPIIIGAIAVTATYVLIEWAWGEYKISQTIVE